MLSRDHVLALMREGAEADLPNAAIVAERLEEIRRDESLSLDASETPR